MKNTRNEDERARVTRMSTLGVGDWGDTNEKNRGTTTGSTK